MKKLLFIRSVNFDPIKFSKENIMYDFYCLLARELSRYYVMEVLIQNKNEASIVNLVDEKNFTINVVPNFLEYPRKADILFSRGGNESCNNYVNNMNIPVRAFYGACNIIEPDNKNFNLVFTSDRGYPGKMSHRSNRLYALMLKSCDHNVWKPLGLDKEYDIIHVANINRSAKNHNLFFNTVRELNLKAVAVGYRDRETEEMADGLNIEFTGHLSYQEVNKYINKSKIGIVCTTNTDGPRVMQEILAAGTPVVAHSQEASSDVYIKPETGLLSNGDEFSSSVGKLLEIHDTLDTRSYFVEHFGIDIVAKYLFDIIEHFPIER